MEQQDLIPHLFRAEFSKISAVLTSLFGIEHMDAAEDIASETFLAALETWTYKGIPQNPTAWLYAVAKNKARNYISRNRLFSQKIAVQIKQASPATAEPEIDLSAQNITDSQLQMLFAICHPSLATAAQIGLALRILCGFGIEEIATALLTNKETVAKRLSRAKETLRNVRTPLALPPETEINKRLETVLTTLYLLYSEGYYSESNDAVLREDLCLEAMRVTHLLVQNEKTNVPAANALLALMCFHASRFSARRSDAGASILYYDQDETRWNNELIAKGAYYLHQAAQGTSLSKYHLEAAIAYWHTTKADTNEKWSAILQLYNQLLQIEYSPVAALNRTFALSKVAGATEAIREAEKLRLTGNRYYHTLLGELYKSVNRSTAKQHFHDALALARTQTDRQILLHKIDSL